MKKTLLSLAVAAVSVMGSQAATVQYGYCGDIYSGIGFGRTCVYAAAIEIPASVSSAMKGAKITAVNFGFGKGVNKEITVCVWDDLHQGVEPLSTGTYDALKESSYNLIPLSTPVELDGRDLYVGMIYESKSSKDYPLAVDGDVNGYAPIGDWASISTTVAEAWTEVYGWGGDFGNVCIRAVIEGEGIATELALPTKIQIPAMIRPWTDFDFTIGVRNVGADPIESVEVAYELGASDLTYKTFNFDTPIAAGASGSVNLVGRNNQDGEIDLPARAIVSKVNGKANPCSEIVVSTKFSPSSKLFERRMVLEEYTGVGCQFCPRGYYGIETFTAELKEKGLADKFIPIAVHNYGNDPMSCSAYNAWVNRFISGAPQGSINRMESFSEFDPNLESLREAFPIVYSLTKEYVEIEVEYEQPTDTPEGEEPVYTDVVAKTKMVFAEDIENANYGLAYVVIQNDLGPYNQTNGFSGGRYGEMGGFEKLGTQVSLMFNDVARDIYNWSGDNTACPTNILEGEEYTHTKTMSLKRCTTLKNASLDNVEVAVLLINRTTGEIVNAAKAKIGEKSLNAVEEVAVAPYKVRALQGRIAVDGEYSNVAIYTADGAIAGRYTAGQPIAVEAGLYLVSVDGDKAVKVFVK